MKFYHLAFTSLALLAIGCGSSRVASQEVPTEDINDLALTEVGELYRMYSLEKGAPPKSVADLAPLEIGFPIGTTALRNGDIVLQYGVPLPDVMGLPGEVEAEEVLAHQKQVPQEGGNVLLLDRRIVKMTPEEFAAASKAGGAATPAS